jgi:hypothetical protein
MIVLLHEEWTDDLEEQWQEWLASRPANVREVARRFPPSSLYRVKSTGRRVVVQSFQEADDGAVTMTVWVGGDYNLVLMERSVFGVEADDLEPCELPGADEQVGVLLDLSE